MQLISRTSMVLFLISMLTLLVTGNVIGLPIPQPGGPGRVAVINSTGVNNDCRAVNEYNDTLKQLGWQYDKYMNHQLKAVLDGEHGHYDLIICGSLWNYGNPQNLDAIISSVRCYFDNGGIMLLTDAAYEVMSNWLKTLDGDLWIKYGLLSKLDGAESQTDFGQISSVLKFPNELISGMNGWAYFSQWGKKYTSMIQPMAPGAALMLGAPVSHGAIVVTTSSGLSQEILQNVYAVAWNIKNGLEICPVFAATPKWPGEWSSELRVRNYRGMERRFRLTSVVTTTGARQELPAREIVIPPNAETTIKLALPLTVSGPHKVEIFLDHRLAATRDVVVPAMLELQCNRTILLRTDELIATVKLMRPEKAMTAVKLQIVITHGGEKRVLYDGGGVTKKTIKMPVAELETGKWQLIATANDGKEQIEQKIIIEISDLTQSPTVVKIGEHGELLVNGKVMFPLGTYHIDPSIAKTMGFNCITGPIFSPQQSTLKKDEREWFDTVDALGLKVLQEFSEYARTKEFQPENLRSMASQLRLRPSTLAAYAIDEPSMQGLAPERVMKMCQLLKECDPDHPTFICEMPVALPRYAQCSDIISIDPYPVRTGAHDSLEGVAKDIETAVVAGEGRPVWGVIQAHRVPPPTPGARYPTPDEVRCMAYLALNHGAKGLLFYAWSDAYEFNGKLWTSGFKFDPALMQSLPVLLKELAQIGPAYVTGEVTRIMAPRNASALDIVNIIHEGKTTMVAVNPTGREIKTKFNRQDLEFKPFEVKTITR